MRGLLATALLAPTLASALVVPNTWDGVDIASATHSMFRAPGFNYFPPSPSPLTVAQPKYPMPFASLSRSRLPHRTPKHIRLHWYAAVILQLVARTVTNILPSD